MRYSLILMGALMTLAFAACSDSATIASSTTTVSPTVDTTLPSDSSTSTTTVSSTEGTATTALETTTTLVSETTTTVFELPGEEIDFGPRPGDQLMVVGVEFDDVLNLRFAPGTDQEILAGLSPVETEVFAIGNTRTLTQSWWIEVNHGGVVGWVNLRFVAYEGPTDDVTSSIVSRLGEIPSAETMLDLGLLVANELASEDPVSRITVTVAASVGDLGEITLDVIGLGDDAVHGLRLHIFGQSDGDGFSLKSVEQTTLCGRGGGSGALCP